MQEVLKIEKIASMLKDIENDAHKYSRGHALLVAGNRDMLGCLILAGRAAQRSGIGVLSIKSCKEANNLIFSTIPEALIYNKEKSYDAIAVGPGIGKETKTRKYLERLFASTKSPMLIDADALNIISENPYLISLIPKESILTPHIGEFERLFGKSISREKRIEVQKIQAQKLKLNIVLKGPATSIATSNGDIYINSTGNRAMATAGSGDVLTGVMLALLAQGYKSSEAAQIGVFVHGLAGDMALESKALFSLIASDIIDFLPQSWQEITKYTSFV